MKSPSLAFYYRLNLILCRALILMVIAVVGCERSSFTDSGKTASEEKTEDAKPKKPKVAKNQAPTLKARNQTIRAGETLNFTAIGEDEDGDKLSYSMTDLFKAKIDAETGEFSWQTSKGHAGEHEVTLSVSDGDETTPLSISIFVSDGENPKDSKFDLCPDQSKVKYTALLVDSMDSTYGNERAQFEKHIQENSLTLKQKGIEFSWQKIHDGNAANFSELMALDFDKIDQIWLVAGKDKHYSDEQYDQLYTKIADFHKNGKGVAIFADNEPYFLHANELSKAMGLVDAASQLFTEKSLDKGDATDLITVVSGNIKAGQAKSHALFAGLVKLTGGVTLGRINVDKILAEHQLLAISTLGFNNIAVIEEKTPSRNRVLFDGGFTKMMEGRFTLEGTSRYFRNIGCYLQGH